MKKINNSLWGVLFIVIGVIIGINSLGIADINIFFDGWWTLFIIIPCFINLFNDEGKFSNVIGLIVGIMLFLSCRGLIDIKLAWNLLLPTIFIMIGLFIIFKDNVSSKVKDEINKLNKNSGNMEEYCATFGEQNVEFSEEIFNGCNLSAIFGTIKCNLEKSKIKDDVINVLSLFGSNNIVVPDNVMVKVKGTPIFGSIKNNKISVKDGDKTIYINATCLFGEVVIK